MKICFFGTGGVGGYFGAITSFQRDVESKGKMNEGDLFGGTLIRLGEELKVPVPETKKVYEKLLNSINERI
jgi:2-dehydropantoate 2-reductase